MENLQLTDVMYPEPMQREHVMPLATISPFVTALKKNFFNITQGHNALCDAKKFKEAAQTFVKDHPTFTVVIYDWDKSLNALDKVAKQAATVTYMTGDNNAPELFANGGKWCTTKRRAE